jgi:hypothetical protein
MAVAGHAIRFFASPLCALLVSNQAIRIGMPMIHTICYSAVVRFAVSCWVSPLMLPGPSAR